MPGTTPAAQPATQHSSLPTTLVGASPKSYLTAPAAVEWIRIVGEGLAAHPERGDGVFACLPFPIIPDAIRALGPLGVLIGSQDVSRHPVGAFTGEVSAELLSGLGSRFAMVGHPERVKYFGETPDDFGAKSRAAAEHGIAPILVVGEPERGHDPAGVIGPQLDAAFGDVSDDAPVVVAYEPTWVIGAAEPAPADHIVGVVAGIRALLAQRSGESRVLYGGSAGPGTFAAIAAEGRASGRLDGIPAGVFLGRAGVDPHGFLATIAEVREHRA
ncbi:triose-phosphate isomerase family protein [Schumannella soli]|uniref:Triosephosphate isomerase n=1 Tax=Schumannella soli TaxID=2590779 RepID=A0A506XZN1_9MICO|nr:triose-phosphate isomerase family protein [Schumannella soli]TPW74860.1 triosephosphate isomerase [Schumannella soli]